MAIPSRGIGWGTEDNLLWQISKQLERLTCVTAGGCGAITTTTTTTTLPVYRVFTALLTQSGGDNPDTIGGNGGTLDAGYTYLIIDNPDNYDLTLYGAPNNLPGTYFICTNSILNLPYSSSLQIGVNYGAPVATVLENTIGNIWFTYNTQGSYLVNSTNLFIEDKSMAIIGTPMESVNNSNFAGIVENGPTQFLIDVVEPAGNSLDDLLFKTPIEIRVYN